MVYEMPRNDDPKAVGIDPAALLPSCRKVQSSVYWPVPIDKRANQLVDLAVAAGERLSKADVLGALVRAAPADGEQIGAMVREYRRSRAGDVVLRSNDGAEVISIEARRPGRRPAPSP
jgi:hypothetical protein